MSLSKAGWRQPFFCATAPPTATPFGVEQSVSKVNRH